MDTRVSPVLMTMNGDSNCRCVFFPFTFPKTNSSPLKIGHSQKESCLPTIHFQAVRFREGSWLILIVVLHDFVTVVNRWHLKAPLSYGSKHDHPNPKHRCFPFVSFCFFTFQPWILGPKFGPSWQRQSPYGWGVYQRMGCWNGDTSVPLDTYERLLDAFLYSPATHTFVHGGKFKCRWETCFFMFFLAKCLFCKTSRQRSFRSFLTLYSYIYIYHMCVYMIIYIYKICMLIRCVSLGN